MAEIPVIGFTALSGTGKTTLITQIIARLTAEGIRVGVVKIAHPNFDLDTPGKDSYRLRKAGAGQTLVASKNRSVLIREWQRAEVPGVVDLLQQMDLQALDIVLVEGARDQKLRKIEIYREALRQGLRSESDLSIIAVFSDCQLRLRAGVDRFDLDDIEAQVTFLKSFII